MWDAGNEIWDVRNGKSDVSCSHPTSHFPHGILIQIELCLKKWEMGFKWEFSWLMGILWSYFEHFWGLANILNVLVCLWPVSLCQSYHTSFERQYKELSFNPNWLPITFLISFCDSILLHVQSGLKQEIVLPQEWEKVCQWQDVLL